MDIGEYRKAEALKLRARIFAYMVENPGVKQIQMAERFNVNGGTISRHVKAIRSGWRPAPEDADGNA